jgi:hydroxypyruvate isomerase
MPQFAANLTMLFTETPFLDRFEKAHNSGFKAVEFLFPYPFAAAEIKNKLDQYGLKLVLHNLPAGDWDAGERGIACHPDRLAEFRTGVAKAIEYAKVLGVPQLNCLAGKVPAGVDSKLLHDTFVSNLKYASAELKADKKVVLAAIEQNWQALQYASDELKKDEDKYNKARHRIKRGRNTHLWTDTIFWFNQYINCRCSVFWMY